MKTGRETTIFPLPLTHVQVRHHFFGPSEPSEGAPVIFTHEVDL